ncbi:MAG: hypothetical protein WBF79_07900 [Rhodococcus sp. (in: high G+C Gram-positive bacteria)]
MSERIVWAVRSVLAVGVVVVMCGCADQDVDPVGAASGQTPVECRNVDSYSGRFVVGNPPAGQAPELMPIEPGTEVTRVPVPILSSVDVESNPGSSVVTYTVRGDGMIGWTARFVQTAQLRGTGDLVPVTEPCRLQVDLTGVDSNSVDAGSERPTSVTVDSLGSPVAEVLTYRSSDSLLQSFVGIGDAEPTVAVEAVDGSAVLSLTVSS